MPAFPKNIEPLLDCFGCFLKGFDQVNKVSQIQLPKPKTEIGFTKAKDELFIHCYKGITEHLNRKSRLSLQFEKNKTCVFSVKKFEHYSEQFIHTEVVNLGYREIKYLYKNWLSVAYKCEVFESNFDIWRQNKKTIPRPSQSSAPKKSTMSPNNEKTCMFPIGWWFERQILFSNHFIQFPTTVNPSISINLQSTYRKSCSSQSPTTESTGLLILVTTLVLVQ